MAQFLYLSGLNIDFRGMVELLCATGMCIFSAKGGTHSSGAWRPDEACQLKVSKLGQVSAMLLEGVEEFSVSHRSDTNLTLAPDLDPCSWRGC